MAEDAEPDSSEEIPEIEERDIEFEDHPVGASREVEETLASLRESAQQGALAEVLAKYSPEEFNELVENISKEYQESQRRKTIFRGITLFASVILVLLLFGGLMYFVMQTGADGGALIFFAGTLAGYFMRLAADFY